MYTCSRFPDQPHGIDRQRVSHAWSQPAIRYNPHAGLLGLAIEPMLLPHGFGVPPEITKRNPAGNRHFRQRQVVEIGHRAERHLVALERSSYGRFVANIERDRLRNLTPHQLVDPVGRRFRSRGVGIRQGDARRFPKPAQVIRGGNSLPPRSQHDVGKCHISFEREP